MIAFLPFHNKYLISIDNFLPKTNILSKCLLWVIQYSTGMLLAIEQEIIRSKSVIEGNFKVNTKENKMFEGIARTDSIDIFPDTSGNINSHSKDVQVDNVYQKQKSQEFTFINIYPTSLQGKNTGPG